MFRSLAYAEHYLTVAYIVRRYNMSLFDTTYADIETVSDYGMPMAKAGSQGVRVVVH